MRDEIQHQLSKHHHKNKLYIQCQVKFLGLVYLYVIVLSVTVFTVRYVCLLCRVQFFVDFVSFLSMIIYEVLIHYYDV